MKIKNDIKSLMREYERLFSKNETRILDSLKRITAALHGQIPDRIPVIQVSQTILYPRHEIFYSREKNLISQLCNINLTLAHDTDYVPYLDPFEGVTILAEAFGCRVEVPENGDPWVREPLIKGDPYDVYLLKKPAIDNEVYRRVFETLRYFEEKSGGIIPVGATDPQGPLDVASLIWNNQDFLLACVLHKKEVHHLLELVTEAFIEFYSMQYEMLKNPAYPVHSFPLVDSNDGISISDDEAVLLSPGLYEEFAVSYLNRISKKFGGLYYHCCGDYGFLLEKIISIDGLRAINGHLSPEEFKPEYVDRVTDSGKGLFIGISDREIGWENPEWDSEEIMEIYDSYYIPSVIGNSGGRGVVLVGYGGYTGYLELDEGGVSSVKGAGQMVGAGGHTVERSPLLNVPVEKKNENFDHILSLIESHLKKMKRFPE
ncbi:MAG: uroporphyrinogen decarboxylase family protein [Spirochaetota bacterium]